MKIVIMGLTASGKSSQARALAAEYHLTYVSGSALLLEALGHQDDPVEHFWLEQRGRDLDNRRDITTVDRDVDKQLVARFSGAANAITDSWTLAWLSDQANLIRIYLKPSLEARALRAVGSKRNRRYDTAELARLIQHKDESSRQRFLSLYSFDIFDTTSFDLALDSSALSFDATQSIIRHYVHERLHAHSPEEVE